MKKFCLLIVHGVDITIWSWSGDTVERLQADEEQMADTEQNMQEEVDEQELVTTITDLNNCNVNLQRISNRISVLALQTLVTSVDELLELARQSEQRHSSSHAELLNTEHLRRHIARDAN